MSNEIRGYVIGTYNVGSNKIEWSGGGVCSELGIGISVPYYYLNDFAISFMEGELDWRDSPEFHSEVDALHFIYKQYVRCCKKGLLQKNPVFSGYISKFYDNLANNVYKNELDLEEAEELIEEFKTLLKNLLK